MKLWNGLRFAIAVLLFIMAVYIVRTDITSAMRVEDAAQFSGRGTRESPYLIRSAEELSRLAELVNSGHSFKGQFFEQTENIDLSACQKWTPIGNARDTCFFEGTYDGACHYIENLHIPKQKDEDVDAGLFGQMNGVVCNLGIMSGSIHGTCSGSIASCGNGIIAHCWNRASIQGSQKAGGISATFTGDILCCWNEGRLKGKTHAQIVCDGEGTLFGCTSVADNLAGKNYYGQMLDSCKSDACAAYVEARFKKAKYDYDIQNIELRSDWGIEDV